MIKGKVSKTTSLSTLNRFEVVEKEASLLTQDGKRTTLVRQGLSTGPAVSVIPYFRHTDNSQWYVIMVSEYRPMVDDVCLEAPGGLIEPGLRPEEQMIKVIKDETRITVPQNLIRVTGTKWVANSFSDQMVWLGTIEIPVKNLESFVKNLSGRSNPEGTLEVTEVLVLPLLPLLKDLYFKVEYGLTAYQLLELGLCLKLIDFST